jgi:arginyl-tRNA synthetase
MNLIEQIQHSFTLFLEKTYAPLDAALTKTIATTLNTDETKQEFGDLSSNAAMILAKSLKKNPREIAQQIIAEFRHPAIARIELAGPGFLNIFLTLEAFKEITCDLYESKENFFKLNPTALRSHYNVEFVSANPTGPLHLGHGRGGIIGDVFGNIATFVGHQSTKEFYINDAGSQMQKLGQSLKARCEQQLGVDAVIPEGGYHGEYLVALAKECLGHYGDGVVRESDAFFTQYAQEKLLAEQKETLKEYGINFDVWFSEKTLHTDGSIDKTLTLLEKNGYIFEQEGALWFKSTAFGDDKDRVVRKSTGELTYVAADSAYLKNKIDRGFNHLVMVLGHDHHGYEHRLQALLQALGFADSVKLEILFYQLVKMKEGGQLVRMSKRAGNIVTLEGVIETVGTDVARFFYLNRKADAQLEFDLDLALTHSEENPVYYVQYAYVRTNSILCKAQEHTQFHALNESDIAHIGHEEAFLLKKMVALKPLLTTILDNHQTHALTYYVLELAQTFHAYYSKNRVIDLQNVEKSRARLLMITILKDTLATSLQLLGISRPEKM